jgi:xylulokinase
VHTFCHAVHGKWHMMGVTLSAGGSLDWFVDRLCPAEAAAAKKSKRSAFELLTKEAEAVAAGSEGLFFLPYLSGERTPHADPLARGAFIGLTLAHGRGHLIRSVLEGVCYSLRESLEIFDSLGVPLRQVRASGGGAKSSLWREIQAACFGQKVATLNAEEGPAYGVALLAAVGGGAFRDIREACTATVRVVGQTAIDRKSQAVYDRAFPVYERLYRSLQDDFQRIAGLDA